MAEQWSAVPIQARARGESLLGLGNAPIRLSACVQIHVTGGLGAWRQGYT
jgi:hypothetical protein